MNKILVTIGPDVFLSWEIIAIGIYVDTCKVFVRLRKYRQAFHYSFRTNSEAKRFHAKAVAAWSAALSVK